MNFHEDLAGEIVTTGAQRKKHDHAQWALVSLNRKCEVEFKRKIAKIIAEQERIIKTRGYLHHEELNFLDRLNICESDQNPLSIKCAAI